MPTWYLRLRPDAHRLPADRGHLIDKFSDDTAPPSVTPPGRCSPRMFMISTISVNDRRAPGQR